MKTRHTGWAARLASLALGLAFVATGCASTEMTNTWTEPSAKGAAISKVAVIAMTQDPGMRRMAETSAAANLQGAQAVPSYQALGETDMRNFEAVKDQLTKQGFQGALVMRVAGVNERTRAVPYGTFGGYYGWAGSMVYAPGYVETDTIVHVISNLYSLPDEKLIWSGMSQTFNPASVESAMNGVSKAVAKSLQKDRLIL